MKPPATRYPGETPELRRTVDLRLVLPALVVSLAAMLGLLWHWWSALVIGAPAMVAGPIAYRWIHRTGSGYDSISRTRLSWAATALFVAGVLAAGPITVRLAAAEHDQLREPASRGASAMLRVTVTERPRPIRTAGYAGRQAGARAVVVPADVIDGTRSLVDGQVLESSGAVLLLAPYADWARLLPGQEVTVTGTLAAAKPGELTVAVVSVRGPPADVSPAPPWQRAAESLRSGLRDAGSVLPGEEAGLVPGLVVGDTSTLAPDVERDFTDAGMSHLLAVSGANLAMVGGAVLLLLRRLLRLGPRLSAAVAAGALVGFVILVGPDPSVLRAAVMGVVALLAMFLGRQASAMPALSMSVIVLVLVDPGMAVNFGFALSVLATGALVLLAPRWVETLARRGMPAGYAEAVVIPLAAFVVTAPVIAGMAGRVSVVSVVANVLAAPVVAPVTVLGALAAVLASWWPSAAQVLLHVAGPGVGWLVTVARHAARMPGAVMPWPSGWWGGLLATVVAGALVLALRRRRFRLGLALLLVVVLLVLVPVRVLAPAWPPAGWALVVCDVGQGDAVVLATSEPGRAVVIDTGPEPRPVGDCLDRLGVDRIPLLVLSHLHADHVGGLESVFDGRAVGAVAVGPGRSPGWAWQQVVTETSRAGVPLLELSVGQHLRWPGIDMDVVGPRYVTARQTTEEDGTAINNTSLVLRADTTVGRILLAGDVELAAQGDLLADGTDVRADVLKVPHHGSRFSLPRFLQAVSPRVALISVGAGNPYGHPSKSTVDILAGLGAVMARTDQDGDTAVVPDGGTDEVVRRGDPRGPPR